MLLVLLLLRLGLAKVGTDQLEYFEEMYEVIEKGEQEEEIQCE